MLSIKLFQNLRLKAMYQWLFSYRTGKQMNHASRVYAEKNYELRENEISMKRFEQMLRFWHVKSKDFNFISEFELNRFEFLKFLLLSCVVKIEMNIFYNLYAIFILNSGFMERKLK